VVDHTSGEKIPAGGRVSQSSQAATLVSSKTTSPTLGTNVLGDLTTGTDTDRTKERFGGIWARVYGPTGELLGERKDLHDELERLDFQFNGITGNSYSDLPILEGFEKLQEILDQLPELPVRPRVFPKPDGILPTPPFRKE